MTHGTLCSTNQCCMASLECVSTQQVWGFCAINLVNAALDPRLKNLLLEKAFSRMPRARSSTLSSFTQSAVYDGMRSNDSGVSKPTVISAWVADGREATMRWPRR